MSPGGLGTSAEELPRGPGREAPVTEEEIASLPEPAQAYLRFMGVVGRPRTWSFRLAWKGRFRPGADRAWTACEAWQYNSSLEVARIFRMRLRFVGVLPVIGWDTYVRGKGRLVVRLLDRFTILDARGPEYDDGELVTWLDDAVFFAPSMLLGASVAWAAAGGDCFELKLTDRTRTVSGRVFVDRQGAPRSFETLDRFCEDPSNPRRLIRARWETPVDEWEVVDGRPVPRSARAIWRLPQGPFPYAEFRVQPGSLAINVPPVD